MAIKWYNVVAIAPELAKTAAGEQEALLSFVNRRIDDTVWGSTEDADFGRAYYAAHLATLARLRGSGTITSESVGALSRSYGPTGIKGFYGLTSYGAMFETLSRQLPTVLGLVT